MFRPIAPWNLSEYRNLSLGRVKDLLLDFTINEGRVERMFTHKGFKEFREYISHVEKEGRDEFTKEDLIEIVKILQKDAGTQNFSSYTKRTNTPLASYYMLLFQSAYAEFRLGIEALTNRNYLTEENIDFIYRIFMSSNNTVSASECADMLVLMHEAGIADPLKFLDIKENSKYTEEKNAKLLNKNILRVSHIISTLNNAGIWNAENFREAFLHPKLDQIFREFLNNEILNQENFNSLIQHANIFEHPAFERGNLFSRIPRHLFTQNNVTEIFVICARFQNDVEEASEQLDRYITNLIQPQRRAENQLQPGPERREINAAQSTHTKSVHKSVSESAIKLMNEYGKSIEGSKLEDIIRQMQDWVKTLPRNTTNDAARRGLKRMTDVNYAYTDPTSQISTQQLLALAWIAIHDDNRRIGSLEDALTTLVTGIGDEIQRGYNIEKGDGVDEGGSDKFICTGGTFNKIMEKLVGISPLVHIAFVTKETMAAKLPQVVSEEANGYLEEFSASQGKGELHKLFEQIKTDGDLEHIWPNIQENVAKRMHEEFDAYGLTEAVNDSVAYGYAINGAKFVDQYIETHSRINDKKEPKGKEKEKIIKSMLVAARPPAANKGQESLNEMEMLDILDENHTKFVLAQQEIQNALLEISERIKNSRGLFKEQNKNIYENRYAALFELNEELKTACNLCVKTQEKICVGEITYTRNTVQELMTMQKAIISNKVDGAKERCKSHGHLRGLGWLFNEIQKLFRSSQATQVEKVIDHAHHTLIAPRASKKK